MSLQKIKINREIYKEDGESVEEILKKIFRKDSTKNLVSSIDKKKTLW